MEYRELGGVRSGSAGMTWRGESEACRDYGGERNDAAGLV